MIAEAPSPTDWSAIIAAACASLSGLITLYFGLRTKARQDDAANELALIKARAEAAAGHASAASQHALRVEQSVQASREERSKEIGELRAEVREGIHVSNNYNSKIADATQATQAVAEEVRQMRAESQSQPIAPK